MYLESSKNIYKGTLYTKRTTICISTVNHTEKEIQKLNQTVLICYGNSKVSCSIKGTGFTFTKE